jgi:predicted alpha-1,2-mannosidase
MYVKRFCHLIVCIAIVSCSDTVSIPSAEKDQALITYVNPFIGTGGHGHTYPGATMPFGMMQLSPDTRLDGWDGCSGYHYSDHYIYGFSHTHLSGTGVSDYGDVLLMPTNVQQFNNGADGNPGYRAYFSHKNEKAEPGYYKVHLDSTKIDVELTVSKRSGIHKYQYPSQDNQYVILDLEHRDKVLDAKIEKISNTELIGYRHSEAWAKDQRLFFAIKTSHPFNDVLQSPPSAGEPGARRMALKFINPNNEPVLIKVGISAVDASGAVKNLEEEVLHKNFETVKSEAQNTWEKQFEKIVVESDNINYKTNFYTALYHSMLAPNLYQDVDGRYRGMDLEIHKADFKYYTVFSLWDTYRATHPLYTIIEQERTNDFIKTFLAKYDEGGIMPIWDLSANYTGCMIGYHAVPVIADAYLKGIKNYNIDKAYEAMKHSALQDQLGLDAYKAYGFIPVENESESVSKTLEYAYDDWTIAQMARALGNDEDYKEFTERAQSYKNVFDPASKFMRGRFRNTWFAPFDPYEVNFNYTEANAWQYSNYVPQDIAGLIELHGGKAEFEKHLDSVFTAKGNTTGRNQADITGLIGQYAHGNEPSHHMAYLYNYLNRPHKTQEKVNQILTELYQNTPDGISGNEDCGQMSAWYVFSSLGFYPVTPGSNDYIIGAPLFEKSTINLENESQFTIQANNLSETNIYVQNVKLNGKQLDRSFLTHEELMTGGFLEFDMTDTPSEWGNRHSTEPVSAIVDHRIVPVPFIASGEVAFKNSTTVVLQSIDSESDIYFRRDLGTFQLYTKPLLIGEPVVLEVYAKRGEQESARIKTRFYEIDPNLSITLETEYANQYNAGGDDALIDGILGTEDFRTGTWQGYWNEDVIATVDLGTENLIYRLQASFLQDQKSWIFLPTQVSIYTSLNGKDFYEQNNWNFGPPIDDENVKIETVDVAKLGKARYVKIIAKKLGKLPEWHLGYPYDGRSWIFIDEIQITKQPVNDESK